MRHAVMGMLILLGVGAGCGRQPASDPTWTEYQVSASVSTNSLFIGQPVDLRVTVDHPSDTTVHFPRLDSETSPLTVQDESSHTTRLREGESRTVAAYRITTLEVGDHVVSSNAIEFVRQDQIVHSNAFPFVSLQVQSALTGDPSYAPDKDLAKWPPGIPRLLIGMAAVAVLAFVFAGLVALWIVKRGRRFAPAPPLPPAHVTALAAISRLRRKDYIEQRRLEPFYVELSDIIRHYIEQRFGIHAPDQTTEEFMILAMNSRLLSPDQQQLTGEFLEQCDQVKFARANPGVDEMRAALEAALQLIEETRISDQAVAA